MPARRRIAFQCFRGARRYAVPTCRSGDFGFAARLLVQQGPKVICRQILVISSVRILTECPKHNVQMVGDDCNQLVAVVQKLRLGEAPGVSAPQARALGSPTCGRC
jgi:hypothetical protein